MIIYRVTNLITNDIYIGQTIKTLNQRISAHKIAAKQIKNKFYNAINKYSWDNFKFEILEYCNNQEELNQSEIFWIHRYNSYKKGYNSTPGGQAVYNEQAKEKVRNKNKLAFNIVLQKFKEKNYTLLLNESDYKGTKYKADYLCNNGHLNNVRLYSIVNVGGSCKICKSNEKRRKYEYIKNILDNENYTLLDSKIDIETTHPAPDYYNCLCPDKHKIKIYINAFLTGTRCRICHINSIRGKKFGIEFSNKRKKIARINGTYIHLLQEEIIKIKEAIANKVTCYKITKYILQNKYSYKIIKSRIKEILLGEL